jgi:tripartite-type tricarboxylate transporter receptor subunit TctC
MKFAIHAMAAVALAASAMVATSASAQSYPDRPIKLIVPFAPGGGGDQLVLSFIDELSKELGQPIVKENHGGGNSVIGTNMVAKAPADGYTIGVATTGYTANPYLYKSLPYDIEKDLMPVSIVAAYPFALAVRADFPAKSVEELIAWAKANPGKLTSANTGRGAGAQFSTGLLSSLAGIEIKNVAFQGAGPALTAVAGGFVDFIFSNYSGLIPFVEGGKMRLLGNTGTQPFGEPPLPPLSGAGVPGYEFLQYWALIAPAGTPDDVVARLNEGLKKVFTDPAVRDRMLKVNAEIIVNTPEEAKAYIVRQSAQAKEIVDALGLQPE